MKPSFRMRLFLACFLVACGGPVDDVVTTATIDATARDSSFGFPDGKAEAEASGPLYTGGPLTCGKCTCDGTLYACLAGLCEAPPPSDAGMDADADANTNADASDAAVTTCGKNLACWEIPKACLPKPTCDCIKAETGLTCTVAADGSGFILACP